MGGAAAIPRIRAAAHGARPPHVVLGLLRPRGAERRRFGGPRRTHYRPARASGGRVQAPRVAARKLGRAGQLWPTRAPGGPCSNEGAVPPQNVRLVAEAPSSRGSVLPSCGAPREAVRARLRRDRWRHEAAGAFVDLPLRQAWRPAVRRAPADLSGRPRPRRSLCR